MNEPLNDNFLSEVVQDEVTRVKLVLESCSFFNTETIANVAKVYGQARETDNSRPVLAIGTPTGLVIYDAKEKCVEKKIGVFNNSTINGIEWISANSLILWSSRLQINDAIAYSASNELGQQSAKNEIIVIDIRTGNASTF